MYRAFRTSNLSFQNTTADESEYCAQASKIRDVLISASKGGRLDGSKIRETWFPQQIDAKVFISHSHKDRATAIQLAHWLGDNFGITAFIDSAVWLYADDLLREIDDLHCYNRTSQTYSYGKRNGTTSHVHMMLATALALMLDSCECAIFLDTPNSVSREDAVENTGSPWIMYEINLISMIRRKLPKRSVSFSRRILNESEKRARASLEIDYSIDLSTLTRLSADSFKEWRSQCDGMTETDALDLLYANFP